MKITTWNSVWTRPDGGKCIVPCFASKEKAEECGKETHNDLYIGGYRYSHAEPDEHEFDEKKMEGELLPSVDSDFNRFMTFDGQTGLWAEWYKELAKRHDLELWWDEDHFDCYFAFSKPGKYVGVRNGGKSGTRLV